MGALFYPEGQILHPDGPELQHNHDPWTTPSDSSTTKDGDLGVLRIEFDHHRAAPFQDGNHPVIALVVDRKPHHAPTRVGTERNLMNLNQLVEMIALDV